MDLIFKFLIALGFIFFAIFVVPFLVLVLLWGIFGITAGLMTINPVVGLYIGIVILGVFLKLLVRGKDNW